MNRRREPMPIGFNLEEWTAFKDAIKTIDERFNCRSGKFKNNIKSEKDELIGDLINQNHLLKPEWFENKNYKSKARMGLRIQSNLNENDRTSIASESSTFMVTGSEISETSVTMTIQSDFFLNSEYERSEEVSDHVNSDDNNISMVNSESPEEDTVATDSISYLKTQLEREKLELAIERVKAERLKEVQENLKREQENLKLALENMKLQEQINK